ncbi:MAG: DUF429 domain-containing protein [Anaerolineales bacterium]|nr:DUF429 domain-containing protein [Anaerolineales bacterium]
MPAPESVFIGFDFTAHKKLIAYAVLDSDLRILKLDRGDVEAALAVASAWPVGVVALNAPAGLARKAPGGSRKPKPLNQAEACEARPAESELRRRGIPVPLTPATLTACPLWMRTGFGLYRKLEECGFVEYPNADAPRQRLETQALAGYSVLVGMAPRPRQTVEGRLQRQLLLYERGLRIPDPMDFFEEITRHKTLQGNWPMELLYAPEELNALLAALTAWTAIHKPAEISVVGAEGQIVLPVGQLKEKY